MKNKSVLITGAAKRIGKSIALYMAEGGWNVAIHYNDSKNEADALVEEIKKTGVKVAAIQADLSDSKQVSKILPQANEKLGPIHCLINNASIFNNDNIANLKEESLNEHMQINCHAPIMLAQNFAKQLEGQGNIINMLDYCVLNLPEKFLSYAISKSALWTATQMLARQLAPNIRVNAIGPGHVLPNDRESDGGFDKACKATPLQVATGLNEVSNAINFILSTPSFTGQILALDSGKHLVGAEFY